jgi:hypothetical protein
MDHSAENGFDMTSLEGGANPMNPSLKRNVPNSPAVNQG